MIILLILFCIGSTFAQTIYLNNTINVTSIMNSGIIAPEFSSGNNQRDCAMPTLYIYPDQLHKNYTITSKGIIITSITSKWNHI